MLTLIKRFFLALHHRITAKIVIAVVGGVLLSGILQAYLLARIEKNRQDANARTQAQLVAILLHSAMVRQDIPAEERTERMRETLAALSHAANELSIDVLDASGNSLFSTGAGQSPGPPAAGRMVLPLHGPGCSADEHAEFRRLASIAVVPHSSPGARAEYRLLEYYRSTVMVLIPLLILLVVWVVVQRPISQLAQGVARIEQGDLSVRVSAPSRDELGRFADSLNMMLESLRLKNAEIQAMHEAQLTQAGRIANVGEIASGLAHEIRNPLHGISSALSVIQERADDDTSAIIAEIQNQVARVLKLLTDMLSYARPSAPNVELCDLSQVIDRTLRLVAADIEARSVKVERRVGANVPSTYLDQGRMQQVYLNLILNAIQAGGDKVSIVLEWDRPRNRIISRVKDNGPGISPEVAERIFEPFFTTRKEGTGLGLPTCRNLVTQSGGTLRLVPGPDKGACFEIDLPVIASQSLATPRAPEDPQGGERNSVLDTYLIGLACGCPYGSEETCPARLLRHIRSLGVDERGKAVKTLGEEEKVLLQQRHIECCFRRREAKASADGQKDASPGLQNEKG